ncbi:MAG TPA: chemotaxis protein CheW [Planctomycetota bacterium]|jgi:purine-binding chemotaxis protein CheW
MANAKERDVLDEDDQFEEDEDSQKDKYLTFRIAEEEYGVEIACVLEIVTAQRITEVPDMPDYLKGVINLRGRVVPVIDVRARFRLPARPYDDRTCFIVVQLQDMSVGLVVDSVSDVLLIPGQQVSLPPKLTSGPASRYIKGMGRAGETVKILLDVNKLLLDSETAQVGALQP